jgi:hypothetical protein
MELAWVADVLRSVTEVSCQFKFRIHGINSFYAERAIAGALMLENVEVQFVRSLPYSRFLRSLRSVSIGLSPIIASSPFSRGKSFGKILGYLDAKVPVICSNEADHALFFGPQSGIVSNDKSVWVEMISYLLDSPLRRDQISDAAFLDFSNRLTIDAAARRVDQFLREVLD